MVDRQCLIFPKERMLTDMPYQPARIRRKTDYEVRGLRYSVHEWGEQAWPKLLLLHGWGDSGATFQFVVDALSRNWRVLAPDWRGFGDSAASGGPYWFPDYLADLHALLQTMSITAPLPIVGHSMGGNVAALYAGIFPAAVSHFVNIEGFGLPDSNPEDAPERYQRWIANMARPRLHPGYDSLLPLVERIQERSPGISDDRAAFVAECWTSLDTNGRLRLKADLAHRWPNAILYRRAEAEACWRRITAPTLLLSGADSEFETGIRDWSRPADELPYPDARHVVVEAAGHMLHFEQPNRLATLIEEFIT